jgi:hypothetical protein
MSAPILTPGRGASAGDVNPPVVPAAAARPDQCIHDLLPASCIWCTPRPNVEDLGVDLDEPSQPGRTTPSTARWLVASFHGRCADCDEAIMPGDAVRRARGHTPATYLCEACGELNG